MNKQTLIRIFLGLSFAIEFFYEATQNCASHSTGCPTRDFLLNPLERLDFFSYSLGPLFVGVLLYFLVGYFLVFCIQRILYRTA